MDKQDFINEMIHLVWREYALQAQVNSSKGTDYHWLLAYNYLNYERKLAQAKMLIEAVLLGHYLLAGALK